MLFYGGKFDRHLPLPHPISLTRSGLPRNIPSFHRQMIKKRDAKADSVRLVVLLVFQAHLSTQENRVSCHLLPLFR